MARAVAKNKGFTMIPDPIAQRTDLSFAAKCVLGYMARRASGGVWSGGVRLLATLWGTKHQRIADAILELERADMIRIERGKRGQRSRYHIPKASVYPTLSESSSCAAAGKSVRISDGASAIPTLAADIRTRKRLRPIESKKKPPTPLERGREELSSSGTKGEKTDAMKPDALSEVQRAALALFYPSNPPGTQRRYIEAYLRDLDGFSTTPEQVQRRYDRWPEVFPNATCTLRALVKHWDALAPPPPNPYDPWQGKPPTVPPRDED